MVAMFENSSGEETEEKDSDSEEEEEELAIVAKEWQRLQTR